MHLYTGHRDSPPSTDRELPPRVTTREPFDGKSIALARSRQPPLRRGTVRRQSDRPSPEPRTCAIDRESTATCPDQSGPRGSGSRRFVMRVPSLQGFPRSCRSSPPRRPLSAHTRRYTVQRPPRCLHLPHRAGNHPVRTPFESPNFAASGRGQTSRQRPCAYVVYMGLARCQSRSIGNFTRAVTDQISSVDTYYNPTVDRLKTEGRRSLVEYRRGHAPERSIAPRVRVWPMLCALGASCNGAGRNWECRKPM